ncbi:hypothetical protein EWM64_g5539 [Hericium alpestre]|uniref:Reverse transcriptase domain-containing protein n=1 Tax=Hericium alpestre TaxID=135208 RepID=A0A4Y9ZYG6_9AGAM|nr:hypothetical protein EWM64_g5539 [Hericium alpestre]
MYPLAPGEQEALDKFLDKHLKKGYIRPSKSPLASPFFFIKKKDGKLRPVQDYCQLNAMTIKNKYPLLLIPELIDKVREASIFIKFDICWGYNNIRIKDGDQWKAVFLTNCGLFEPMVMFFGLTNFPATFQTMMNDLFRDLLATSKVIIYMDDILIATATLQEHRDIVHRVLTILQENDLYLKPKKCTFEASSIEYLGLILEKGMVKMDPVKLARIKEWPTPKNVRDVRSFLGFGNFYRRFIQGFSIIA